MQKKNVNIRYKNIKSKVIFCFIVLIPVCTFTYIYAESIIKQQEVKDLTIYDSSSGFYEVPMSTNVISSSEKTVQNPTLAITDTLILKDESSGSLGLSIYKLATGGAILHTEVGDGHESAYDVKVFGIGDFTTIKTSYPYACSELTLQQCVESSVYISEKLFSITVDGISAGLPIVSQTTATSTIVATTTVKDVEAPSVHDGILVIASTTSPTETKTEEKTDSIQVILDTINPAETTLVLPPEDLTPEVSLDSLLENSQPTDSPLMIQHNYSTNEEVKNVDF